MRTAHSDIMLFSAGGIDRIRNSVSITRGDVEKRAAPLLQRLGADSKSKYLNLNCSFE